MVWRSIDRPADERVLGALLNPPAIRGLTESLTDLSPTERRTILARLRRARLLAEEDPHNSECLDTHPLVREYFGAQLRSQQIDGWKECNRRLYYYYLTLAPRLPNTFRDMEPLLSAVICGCNAGMFRDALHEVYIPRIQRGNACFAANVLGARGPLLSALVHFFKDGLWGSPIETTVEGQALTAEDQLFILMQAAPYLTATRGLGAPEARICYERAEPLCHSLNRPQFLYVALIGQWRYKLMADKLSVAMQIAERVYSLAQDQDSSTLMIGAYNALAATFYYLGDFESARLHAMRGLQIWRSESPQSSAEDLYTPAIGCMGYAAMAEWHLGEIASSHVNMGEAISLAKKLNDTNGLALALNWAAGLAMNERNLAEADRLASDLIGLSTRHNFAYFLAVGCIHRGWVRCASGDSAEGISWIEQGIRDVRAIATVLGLPASLAQG